MCFETHFLPSAQRDIKKLPSRDLRTSIVKTCLDELEENPRPYGYYTVKGQKDLYPVYSEDGKYRIIYSILDHVRAVIIVGVRLRNEGTYKDIPTKSLSDKIKLLESQVKVMVPLIRKLAGRIGIQWVSNLNDTQIRSLEIAIRVIKEGRGSCTAERIRKLLCVEEDVQTVANDMARLLKEMEEHGAF